MNPTYPLVPIANFIGCTIVSISLLNMATRTCNTGVYIFSFWVFLLNLSCVVNTIIWANDAKDTAPVWCDLCTFVLALTVSQTAECTFLKASHIGILAGTGIPACSLITTRRLYKITRLQDAMAYRQQVGGSFPIDLPIRRFISCD